jgi:hypothetical protein
MKCKHEHTMVTVGNWGPHRAKEICMSCGKWIKWVSRKGEPTTYTQVKYMHDFNKRKTSQSTKTCE